MARAHGEWHVERTQRLYGNEFLELYEDDVITPAGDRGTYATATLKPGVSILAVDGNNHVHLARQFRYALGRETIEAVAGGVEQGEPPLQAAKRELREELGFDAGEWLHLGRLDLDGSIVRCPVDLFVARDLTRIGTDQDDSEDVRRVSVSLEKALEMAMTGGITHAASCALILKAARVLSS